MGTEKSRNLSGVQFCTAEDGRDLHQATDDGNDGLHMWMPSLEVLPILCASDIGSASIDV